MFGIGMPELMVIAVIALLVVGPKKLPDIAKALGKGLSEFRKVTESATDTIKETLRTDELQKDMDSLKDSLLYGKEEEKEVPASPAAADGAGSDAPKPVDGLKDSLLYGKEEEKEAPIPSAAADGAGSDTPKPVDGPKDSPLNGKEEEKEAPVPPAAADGAGSDAPNPVDGLKDSLLHGKEEETG